MIGSYRDDDDIYVKSATKYGLDSSLLLIVVTTGVLGFLYSMYIFISYLIACWKKKNDVYCQIGFMIVFSSIIICNFNNLLFYILWLFPILIVLKMFDINNINVNYNLDINENMKVVIMNDSLLCGGAEIFSLNLFNLLEKNKHDVYLFTFDYNFDKKKDKVKIDKTKMINFKIKNKIGKIFFMPILYIKIRKKLKMISPDVIIVNNLFCSPLTQYISLSGYNAYQVVHDCHFICPKTMCMIDDFNICNGFKNKKCYKKCYYHDSKAKMFLKEKQTRILQVIRKKYIKKFIVPSEWLTNYLIEYDYDAYCLNNPLNFDFFPSKVLLKKLPRIKKIVYVGLINDNKGILKFTDIFKSYVKKNNCFELTIIGRVLDEKSQLKLNSLVDNKNIRYLGVKSNYEVIKYLQESEFIIVPSIIMENYPTTVLEGMLSSSLVLGANRGGIPEMLSNNKGIIFDINDKKSIFSMLDYIKMMKNEEYNEIITNAYNYVKENNSYEKYYLNLLRIIGLTTDKK